MFNSFGKINNEPPYRESEISPFDIIPDIPRDIGDNPFYYNTKEHLCGEYFVIECLTSFSEKLSQKLIGYFCMNNNKCYISENFTLDALYHYSNILDGMNTFKKFVNKYNSNATDTKITSAKLLRVNMSAENPVKFFDINSNTTTEMYCETSIDDLNKEE